MSAYKVIQDIEAEDKLVGPLSFRQFVYALIAAFGLYISFICLTKGAAFLLIIFLPPALLAGFFAFPFGKDQPTEVWAVAKLRFWFKPRRRIWDQSGVKELVTITVPKKVEQIRTNGLSENEVKSRLSALANTIDSRGWAVKNVNLNLSAQPVAASVVAPGSDRLLDVNGLPQEVDSTDIVASDDILDEQNNPIAHQFDEMINASSQAHHQKLVSMMRHKPAPAPPAAPPVTSQAASVTPPANYWFLNQPTGQPTSMASPGVVHAAEPTADEEAFAVNLKAQQAKQLPISAYSHLKTIQPLSAQQASQTATAGPVSLPDGRSQTTQTQTAQPTAAEPVTPAPSPAILNLASNNDLNVATIARQAQQKPELPDEGEVVIALH